MQAVVLGGEGVRCVLGNEQVSCDRRVKKEENSPARDRALYPAASTHQGLLYGWSSQQYKGSAPLDGQERVIPAFNYFQSFELVVWTL